MQIKRGELYYATLDPVIGSEQGGKRPVLILQNDIGNKHSPTVVVAAITSRLGKAKLPTHVNLSSEKLSKDSIVLLEQIRTIDKCRLVEYIGEVTIEEMKQTEDALLVSVGMHRKSGTRVE
jgi:mRNA interferase MazF